nr:hypothetical protein Iba_chr08aCG5970 [Ipomoea batatas]GMD23490.1 hypothetical protein Iba_chr08bCG5770 [Ipomoea batatas]GMD27683.1 hypothetical protein Iba_chr08eCG0220 [Ipomoea batatas]
MISKAVEVASSTSYIALTTCSRSAVLVSICSFSYFSSSKPYELPNCLLIQSSKRVAVRPLSIEIMSPFSWFGFQLPPTNFFGGPQKSIG